jgi:hypothetical protein
MTAEKTADCLQLVQDVQASAQVAVDVLTDMLNYDKVEGRALSLELTVIPMWQLLERIMK